MPSDPEVLMQRLSMVVALTVVLVVGSAMVAGAQSPPPRVTISGLVDNITSYSRNMSLEDLNYQRTRDREWYAHTRVRPDITAEVGTAKLVLGLELDYAWGSSGTNGLKQRYGVTAGTPINTDIGKSATDDGSPIIELKWAYTEFDLGWIPWKTRLRLGAQPFEATYKPAVLASGDFAGVHLASRASPTLKFNVTYAQIEDSLSGVQEGFNGEDFAIVASIEATPIPGLDIRPIYAFAYLDGTTSPFTRQGRGGVSTAAFVNGDQERRHTVGVDARWRRGPFYVDPTVFYQWGEREQTLTGLAAPLQKSGTCQGVAANCQQRTAKRSAWFMDVRGGVDLGPWLLEGAFVYTTGNKAKDDLTNGRTRLKYYEPIDTDTSYYAGWAEISALGIDYFNILYARASGLNPGQAIGYDKYGLLRLGFRPSYALTPAVTLAGAVAESWTDTKVDADGAITAASGLTPRDGKGDHRYLGTEVDLGVTWRFAPNVTFDLVGAYLFAGDAMGSALSTPNGCVPGGNTPGACNAVKVTTSPNGNPKDVQAVTARIRYTF